ncbi:MAG: ZIP family metal transporter [Comamonas sp.]|nr:ZIP family metal transporter [Comamonas sp.]
MKKHPAAIDDSHPRLRSPVEVRHSVRLWIGLTIMMVGVWALCHQFWAYAQNHPVVLQALAGGSAAALATALGTVPVMFSQRMSERTQDTLFGFGAGVMLAACAFSLILPGLEAVRSQGMFGGSGWAAGGVIGCAILLGALTLMVMDKMLPHEHFIKGREGMDVDAARKLQRTWLFVFAIALHNLPEGLAIGVGYASGSAAGNALATGIAIQDVPEGLVVAVALLAAGYSRKLSVLLGMFSGLIEPVGAVLGAAIVSTSLSILPWGLGFAAGAMLFVISHEIIPESHRKGHETYATGGLMLGFVLMMIMDTSLS